MALPPLDDTIAAIATAPGTGAIGIVRLSGPASYAVADTLFASAKGALPSELPPGRAVYGTVTDGRAPIDEALLLTFRSPNSYTGQDVLEIQTHGGPAVVRGVLDACISAGARQAGPGEFTLRAYLNGRLDLAQAEAVLDLVNAATDAARRNASLGLSGALSHKLGAIQTDLTTAYAAVQAAFDYPEEGVPDAMLTEPLTRAAHEVDSLLATAQAGRLSRNGARLAVLGRPNAGKSSLLNALLGYQRSMVSATPGTTRDYLEAPLVIGGVPVTVIDTAGIRATSDHLEAGGVELARAVGRGADVRLLLLDGSEPLGTDVAELVAETSGAAVYVASKSDLDDAWEDYYFGSLDQEPNDDPDNDGFNNRQEQIAGTDPTDSASRFRVESAEAPTIRWTAVEGRTYSIYWTDDLQKSFELIAWGLTYPTSSFTDTEHGDDSSGYYIIAVDLE